MIIDTTRLFACGLLALCACVETKLIGETTPDDSSSTGDEPTATSTPTTTTATTSEPTGEPSTTATSDDSTTDGSDDESTGDPVVGEWTGTYGTGFGNTYFTPCGETDSVRVFDGVPGYEYCPPDIDGEQIWIRVSGTRIEGEYGPELHDAVLLEGPCLVGSCEPQAAFDECTDFDSLCLPPEQQCDPFGQDCPNGSKCSLVDAPEVFDCVPDGVVGEGEACTRTDAFDDCAEGLLCAAPVVGEDGEGTCAQLCGDVSHCDGPDEQCMLGEDLWGVCSTP